MKTKLTIKIVNLNVISGAAFDNSGWSVASAGDVNGDGYEDIIIGAIYADPSSRTDAGTSYNNKAALNNHILQLYYSWRHRR